MKHVFFLAASGVESGLTSISLGVFRALDRRGIRVGFCKPISQESFPEGEVDPSISLVSRLAHHQDKPSKLALLRRHQLALPHQVTTKNQRNPTFIVSRHPHSVIRLTILYWMPEG